MQKPRQAGSPQRAGSPQAQVVSSLQLAARVRQWTLRGERRQVGVDVGSGIVVVFAVFFSFSFLFVYFMLPVTIVLFVYLGKVRAGW